MILVTGASGFCGSRVIARLVKEGERPRALVRNVQAALARLPKDKVEIVAGDTTRAETLTAALDGVDTIIHCAFITADRKPGPGANYYDVNVHGTSNLVATAKRLGVARIIELSGITKDNAPASPRSYMRTRLLADQAIKESGIAWSILGPSIMFGEGAAFFTGLADLINSVPLVTPMIGSGKLRFQPVWVEDVVTCLVKMAHDPMPYDGKVTEIGGPEYYTYSQILDLLMIAIKKRRIKLPGPQPIARLAATVMTAVLAKPPITPAATELFTFENTTTLDAIPYYFGFQPLSLRSWMAEHGVA
jgi:NADH dehydrogenase